MNTLPIIIQQHVDGDDDYDADVNADEQISRCTGLLLCVEKSFKKLGLLRPGGSWFSAIHKQ